MIARSGAVPPEVIEARNRALEITIARIEQDFAGAPVASAPPPVAPEPRHPAPFGVDHSPTQSNAPAPDLQINMAAEAAMRGPSGGHAGADAPAGPIAAEPRPAAVGDDPTTGFARPRRRPYRWLIWVGVLAVIVIAGWLAYPFVQQVTTSAGIGSQPGNATSQSAGDDDDSAGAYMTILHAAEPDALVTAGRGTAQIVNEGAEPAIRIVSVRPDLSRDKQADPLLLELAPGILSQIAGRRATVEIMARSGGAGPATFAVSCEFGDLGDCGRKRFRVGLQPEAIVFSILIDGSYREGQRAFLAINTDVTSAANLSGEGAAVDIVYARLRVADDS